MPRTLSIKCHILLCLTIILFSCAKNKGIVSIKSPDGNLSVVFKIKKEDHHSPYYSVKRTNDTIIEESKLGLKCSNGVSFDKNFEIISVRKHRVNQTWQPVYGERSEIPDHYEEAIILLRKSSPPRHLLTVTFRAYDEGIAFRYTIPEQQHLKNVLIEQEESEFSFGADFKTWAVYSAQAEYEEVTLSQVQPGCERPLTIKINDSHYVAIGEANLVDYARMKFNPKVDKPYALVSSLDGDVRSDLPLSTPWRFVLIGTSPGELLENNYLLLNLNESCKIKDTSWIKPGKIIREVTLTTQGGKACVDFAVKHDLQYVEFDAGWYGHEYNDSSDATTITVDPKRSPGPLDLHEVIRYANERNVGIILYVNRRALEKQLDEILPLYRSWGIKGVKYGFVNVGSQYWTSWLHEAVRKAADNQLIVDIHDEYRPTGYSRTYPNLMTVEGIRGDEEAPSNEHTLITLFTRMIAGAGDNTICYFADRVDERMGSHASQLAKAVCLYSPWQFLYWYDRPAASPRRIGGAGSNEMIISVEPELEFFNQVPTTWDETRVIHGEIEKYATVARRNGNRWFIGSINGNEARRFEIPLSFLEPGKKYIALMYSDDPSINTRTKVRVDRYFVDQKTVINEQITARCGQAIMIVPASGDENYPVYE